MTPAGAPGPRGPRRRIFIVAAPGLEPVAANELRALGLPPSLEVDGDDHTVQLLNLHLRSASRVLVRIASFRARSFIELERHARKVPWGEFVDPDRPVRFRVTSRKSKLYHERAIEERLQAWAGGRAPGPSRSGRDARRDAPAASVTPVPAGLRATATSGTARTDIPGAGAGAQRAGEAFGAAPADDESEGLFEQLFVVRFLRDECVISADSSGALLHLRGYRQAVAKAPLRETLAAAMLLASGWDATTPLLDPMCGSGTIPIEAAMIARRIAPGLEREFAFQRWPSYDATSFADLLAGAREAILPDAPVRIAGSDRDAGAIEASRGNAARAGVEVDFSVRALSAAEVDPATYIVTNPPYGVRVGETRALRDLYATLGKLARRAERLVMFSADPRLERQLGFPLRELLATSNGGIPVRLVASS